jgi:hypothetical protein
MNSCPLASGGTPGLALTGVLAGPARPRMVSRPISRSAPPAAEPACAVAGFDVDDAQGDAGGAPRLRKVTGPGYAAGTGPDREPVVDRHGPGWSG